MPNVRTWVDMGREPDFLAGGERKGEGKRGVVWRREEEGKKGEGRKERR